jgi:hypothetical protein
MSLTLPSARLNGSAFTLGIRAEQNRIAKPHLMLDILQLIGKSSDVKTTVDNFPGVYTKDLFLGRLVDFRLQEREIFAG